MLTALSSRVSTKMALMAGALTIGGYLGSFIVLHGLRVKGVNLPATWVGAIPLVAPWELLKLPAEVNQIDPALVGKGYLAFLASTFMGMVGVTLLNRSTGAKGKNKPPIFGSARWATHNEIKNQGLLEGKGVLLGQLCDGHYLRHDGPEHYALIAPTRSGKGAGVVVPTLLSWPGSVLVYDLKEENWSITAAFRSKISKVVYFNPNSRKSARFNPLLEVRKGEQEVRDVQNIADMITDPDGTGFSDHWIKTGHSLLVGTILHILYAGSKSDQTLAGIARLLSNPGKTIVQTLTEMKDFPHLKNDKGESHPHPVVAQAAREMLNKSENERSGVLSTAMSFLTLYRDPIVAENTSESDFMISDLMDSERPVSLYLIVPPSDINRLRPLIRLVINQICRRLTEEHKPRQRTHKLLLMLDEFPALGRMDFFETALGFIASYGVKAMLVSQSINQLRKVYGDRNSLLDNTHVRLFYAPNTVETAEYISKSLGQTTEEFSTQSEGGKKGSLWMTNVNVSHHYTARPLMTPGEVMELPPTDAILLMGGNAPIRCNKITYYRDQNFISKLGEPPKLKGRDGELRVYEKSMILDGDSGKGNIHSDRWLEVVPLDDDFEIPQTGSENINDDGENDLC